VYKRQVNDREDGHFITTGYYDCACRDQIAVPIHNYIMSSIEKKIRSENKSFFINIAECYWGHERFLARSGLIPYNSSLFKICENIIHGKTDVREIYHIYDNYFPSVLPPGTELLGILGNHDERRALNTFGHRGLRSAVALTIFMSNIIMDYEGSPEGEGWKVFLDNIYVNWNMFDSASHRSLDGFYSEWYRFHRENIGKGYLLWANNNLVVAAIKFTGQSAWVGAFNFADSNQNASIQFDNPVLPLNEDLFYKISDTTYSDITNHSSYYKGIELKFSCINTVVSYTERIKLLKIESVSIEENYSDFIRDSFFRLCEMSEVENIDVNFAFSEFVAHSDCYENLRMYFLENIVPMLWNTNREMLYLGLKRIAFYFFRKNILSESIILDFRHRMQNDDNDCIREICMKLIQYNKRGSMLFLSAEVEPFSKSGGLADVVYELPRQLVKQGEDVFIITGFYRHGTEKVCKKMNDAIDKYGIAYTGVNVNFKIYDDEYSVGVHAGNVDGITYFLLDHFEFFDGLYWGVTSEEKLRRRLAFARCSAEVVLAFNLDVSYTFTNDAYSGLFGGIIKTDPYYSEHTCFKNNAFLHIIHNGGWQYFDSFDRYEKGNDLFGLFNMPLWRVGDFVDPVHANRINCMAAGIRFADRTITVSPSYARQIEFASDGLENILHNVIGISNALGSDFRGKIYQRFNKTGLEEKYYSDFIDHVKGNGNLYAGIEERYPEILKGSDKINLIRDKKRKCIVSRMRNKLLTQFQRGLEVNPDKILITMIHRISEQKGFQLILDASEGVFKKLEYQAIIGGAVSSGDHRAEDIAHGLCMLGNYYPGQINVNIGFQDVSAPLLSSDYFIMPSMHEPGGISQLEAFSAGCLVIARATGGLRDTVAPLMANGTEVEGNGFLFSDYNSWAFFDVMERASSFFMKSSDEIIYRARKNAENSVYFWDRPARIYIDELYNMTETIRIEKPDIRK